MTQAAEGGWSLVCPLQAYLEPEPVGEARLPAEEGREAAEHVVKMVNQGPNTKGTLFFFFEVREEMFLRVVFWVFSSLIPKGRRESFEKSHILKTLKFRAAYYKGKTLSLTHIRSLSFLASLWFESEPLRSVRAALWLLGQPLNFQISNSRE